MHPVFEFISAHAFFCMGGTAGIVLCFLLLGKLTGTVIRFFLRTGVGLGFLLVFSKIGGTLFGLTLGVNLINAAVLGLLGIPGFGLLLLLKTVT